jgi:hypothetical protein
VTEINYNLVGISLDGGDKTDVATECLLLVVIIAVILGLYHLVTNSIGIAEALAKAGFAVLKSGNR